MTMTEQATTFEAYSYRVSARFGSRVQVAVGDHTITVAGPRLGLTVYRLWIAAQIALLTSVFLAVLGALLVWGWRGFLAAFLLLLAHLAAGGFGAGCLWETANLNAFAQGTRGETVTFPLDTVKRIKIGKGWARKGMWLLIFPYVGGTTAWLKAFAYRSRRRMATPAARSCTPCTCKAGRTRRRWPACWSEGQHMAERAAPVS
jgi:hypothetical protein